MGLISSEIVIVIVLPILRFQVIREHSENKNQSKNFYLGLEEKLFKS